MALRVARGLFRLWLVLSVLWIGWEGYTTWQNFPDESDVPYVDGQKAARRALWALGGTATTTQVAQRGYVRKIVRSERLNSDDYWYVRRALAEIAVPIGRAGGRGRPIIWRLKLSKK